MLLAFACGGGTLDSSLTDLEVGDCIAAPGADVSEVETVETVDCGSGNALEVIERFSIGAEDEAFPGDAEVQERTGDGCPENTLFTLFPTRESWENVNDRVSICFAATPVD